MNKYNFNSQKIFNIAVCLLFIYFALWSIISLWGMVVDGFIQENSDKHYEVSIVSLPQQNYLPVAGNRDPTKTNVDKDEVINLIIHYSKIYGVDQETALRIATCESGLRSGAKNPRSSAAGVFQITRPTFDEASRRMGRSWWYDDGDVYIPAVNIEVATWLLSKGESYRWVCR